MAADFRMLQRDLAAHLRDPSGKPAPAAADTRRLAVYRDLVFNNLRGLLANAFPVLHSLHDEANWEALVRAWLRAHRARTPLFPEIGGEFVQWLELEAAAGTMPPWFPELAHYEWMETVVANDEADIAGIAHDPDGDLLDGRPVLSPLARPLIYRFAVQRIQTDAVPAEEPPPVPTCLVIVRDRRDKVGFLEANPLTLQLIEALRQDNGWNGRETLTALAHGTGIDVSAMMEAGVQVLAQLRRRDVVLGTRLTTGR